MSRLIVVRHAPTRAGDRFVGRSEVEVTIEHERSSVTVIEALERAALTPRLVWSSPIQRCAGLARHVAAQRGLEHRIDPRLAEIDHGQFEGRPWSEVQREHRAALDRWMERWEHEGPPGGESARDIEARVRSWLDDAPRTDSLLIGHAGVARALRVILEGRPWPEVMQVPVRHLEIAAIHEIAPR